MADVDLLVLGGGATGIEFADLARLVHGPDLRVGLIDDDPELDLTRWRERGVQHLGTRSALAEVDAPYVAAVGDPRVLAELIAAAAGAGLSPAAPLVHPSAVLGPGTEVGPGSAVFALVATSTDVRIGRHCVVHLGSTIGHDSVIGDRCILTPGVHISGACTLGDGVFLGTGAAVLPLVTIGASTTVGAGSVVTRDLLSGVVALGSPAKPRGRA